MPAYNSENFIAEAIQSVQAQTFTDWELLVVDDASTDGTSRIIREIAALDQRIKPHTFSVNQGAGMARDAGLSMACGRYIAFLDADDLWMPQKLDRQLEFMTRTEQPFSFSYYDLMDEAGKPLGKTVAAPTHLNYGQLYFCNFVGNLTGMYDTDFFGKIEISALRKRQDWMLWLTVLKKIKTASPVPESLAYYRVRRDSLSASKRKMLKYNYAVYRQFHRLNSAASLLFMGIFLIVQLLVKPWYIKKD